MDKSTILFSQLILLGIFICSTTAVSLRHKRNLIAEYQWPEPDPEINRFPHESTCHYYYLVLSDEDITVTKCPDGELFDYIDHKCSRKETARCWSHHFGKMKHHHIALKSRGHFTCPYAWGKYPDIDDCMRYYVCLNGKVKHKKCAPYEHFDKVTRKCVAAISGVCADETDVIELDYKCPRTWGSFYFSKDCSKYYECLEKKPNLRTCPIGTLFHVRKGKCMPQKHVHCGSRHNPYSKKEKTSTVDDSSLSENPSITSSKPDRYVRYTFKEKETESDVKVTTKAKSSTADPNSIIIVRMSSSQPPKEKETESDVKVTTETKPSTANTNSITAERLSSNQPPKEKDFKVTAESKASTEDPNSIIAERLFSNQPPREKDIKVTAGNIASTADSNSITAEELSSNQAPKEKDVKVTAENKARTADPNSITTERWSSSQPPQKKKTESDAKVTAEAKASTADPNSIIIQKVSSLNSEVAGTTQPSEDSTIEKTSLILNKAHATNSQSKQAVSIETKSLNGITTEVTFVNDTDEITDDDLIVTNEFIEISSTPTETASSSISQTITADSAQKTKILIGEVKEHQITVDSPQATTSDECSPEDQTCITQESGRIVRCPDAAGLFPYPGDERRFLVCENFNIRVRYCVGDTIFNFKSKECVGRLIF